MLVSAQLTLTFWGESSLKAWVELILGSGSVLDQSHTVLITVTLK